MEELPGCPPLVAYILFYSRFSVLGHQHFSLVEPRSGEQAVLGDQRSSFSQVSLNACFGGIIYLDTFGRILDQKIATTFDTLWHVFRQPLLDLHWTRSYHHSSQGGSVCVCSDFCILRDHFIFAKKTFADTGRAFFHDAFVPVLGDLKAWIDIYPSAVGIPVVRALPMDAPSVLAFLLNFSAL